MEKIVEDFILDPKINHVSKEEAADESVVRLELFDKPIIGYASANDELFEKFKTDEKITHGRFIPPREWMEDAKTVISIFVPYSKQVKKGNSRNMREPSKEWLHVRREGKNAIDKLSQHIKEILTQQGYLCIAPGIDDHYEEIIGTWLDINRPLTNSDYGSNWSQRHVAYVTGLGTFGLSKTLITKKGVTGAFTSLITNMEHEPTKRDYQGIYDNCSMCGACINICPVKAITFEGKDYTRCSKFHDEFEIKYGPGNGCGKCQVKVPCENGIPKKNQ
ncbi:4Fe-4S binding protein [Methanohalophilus sp. RSK]|uniref:4Fe-4S binding protein n=1 Tax=Methanohalophilus sp. RSK TaxID=2485783 RepID=UPI0013147D1F|nr:4Fe-4S binding protein [Methanohalophilus sp. RSK]